MGIITWCNRFTCVIGIITQNKIAVFDQWQYILQLLPNCCFANINNLVLDYIELNF